ncbi:MAG TPA: Rrf2 family transcriptional regulator [Solirubrobacteraceae bacterium]|nr:Rrf2 family transcriptional regulator [Solirubrobacteraceae bacterium]
MPRPTNTQFSLAVHLLTLLAQAEPGEVRDSAALAISPAASPVHVRRVLGHLRDARLVRAQQGAHGGWMLALPPQEIDLAQVWLAVNGEDPVLGVHSPNPNCEVGRRVAQNLRELDRRALATLLRDLSTTTVAEVLAASQATAAAL